MEYRRNPFTVSCQFKWLFSQERETRINHVANGCLDSRVCSTEKFVAVWTTFFTKNTFSLADLASRFATIEEPQRLCECRLGIHSVPHDTHNFEYTRDI